jgi:hypothetical protein
MSEEEASLGCDTRRFKERKGATAEKEGMEKSCRNGEEYILKHAGIFMNL